MRVGEEHARELSRGDGQGDVFKHVFALLHGKMILYKGAVPWDGSFFMPAFPYASIGWSCFPSSARRTVSPMREKSATSERGFFCGASWRKGTK